jgi:uncharacterized protein involved in type VI secretion and phage assembly
MSPICGEKARYYGKYKGIVWDNLDLKNMGRIIAMVPAVAGDTPITWALPCVPFAGRMAGVFVVPPIGSQVWIEFEQGDPGYPIWTGGFWGSTEEVPSSATSPPAIPPGQNIVIQTTNQNMIVISDAAPSNSTGGIILKSAAGATLIVNDSGIYIDNGQGASIKLVGNTTDVNNDALRVT